MFHTHTHTYTHSYGHYRSLQSLLNQLKTTNTHQPQICSVSLSLELVGIIGSKNATGVIEVHIVKIVLSYHICIHNHPYTWIECSARTASTFVLCPNIFRDDCRKPPFWTLTILLCGLLVFGGDVNNLMSLGLQTQGSHWWPSAVNLL